VSTQVGRLTADEIRLVELMDQVGIGGVGRGGRMRPSSLSGPRSSPIQYLGPPEPSTDDKSASAADTVYLKAVVAMSS
jgi:hypothetical protein